MARFTRELTVTLSGDDLADTLTGEICGYGAFQELRVHYITKDANGSFTLHFEPKKKAVVKAVKAA